MPLPIFAFIKSRRSLGRGRLPTCVVKILVTVYNSSVVKTIAGKVIVITGASSGIGRAAAVALGREGAKLRGILDNRA